MPRKKIKNTYSLAESLEMLSKLQQMAIEDGNISLALKAEELKCKIISMQADKETTLTNENLTRILVDFIDEKTNSKDTGDICPVTPTKETL